MKIGYFIQNYKRGGVNTFVKNLISKNLYNDEIFIISNNNNPGLEFLKKKTKTKNIKFIEYSIFAWDDLLNKDFNYKILIFFKSIYSIFFPITFIYQTIRLFFFFNKRKFDKIMIINGGYPGGDICLAATLAWVKSYPEKKPWINFHNFALKKNRFFLLDYYKNYLDKIIARSVMGFVSVSNICSKSILQRKNLKKNKYLTIYNGHENIKNKSKISIKKKFNLPKNSKVLLMLAEYDLRKGHNLIIKVMENIIKYEKNIFLFIYGYGNQSYINELVRQSSANKNIYLNSYENNNIALIKECDVLLIPSQEYESFGYTAVEAMSQKKPIIATDCGGLPEIINNNVNGFVVKKKDALMFANKILYLINNKKLLKKFSLNSFSIYKKKFSNTKMIKSYNNLIKYNKVSR